LAYDLSEPLEETRTAKIEINCDDGNLTIDSLAAGEPLLASGMLQYAEKQGPPTRSLSSSGGQTTLTLKGGSAGRPWFHLPWSACNGAHEWQIHLNPTVSFDVTARSGGGNIKLDLAGTTLASLSTETGGGNIDVVLPDNPVGFTVYAKSGAGNVTVQMPGNIEARIQAASGLGKVIVDPSFNKIDSKTYQSAGYDGAAHKADITVATGAGNVVVSTRM
jgi:hypothetical protein